ncbi:MAG TPA: C4-type zinc ribbon domain-containing protein [Flavobacteriales bacterium]
MAKTETKAPAKEAKPANPATKAEITIAEKLVELYRLQTLDSQVDRIRIQRGELPLEVQDLEDEVAGLETRLKKLEDDLKEAETAVTDKQNFIKDAKAQIKKYEGQQSKVRNNREFDSLSKEVEFQNLEIQLAEKRIKEGKFQSESKGALVEESKKLYKERKKDLDLKKKELDDIIAETEKEEKDLQKKSDAAAKLIEERLLSAYRRIRGNARNGLGVVPVERGSCGGCFNAIPPQRQLDISSHKKIIVCEHCGRILVDEYVVDRVKGEN